MSRQTTAQKRKIRRMMHWSRRKENKKNNENFCAKNRSTRKKMSLGYNSDESSADDLQVSSSTSSKSSVASILETIFPFSKAKLQRQSKKESLGKVSSGRRSRSSKSSSTNSIWRTVSSTLGLDQK